MQKNDIKDLIDNLPVIEIPNKFKNQDEYLRFLTAQGLVKRYQKVGDEIRDRAEYELSIIIQFGFSNYFLIVADYVNWAKKNNIPTGPGRGASASSIVAYALGITNIDPIKYKLIFERFINPDDIKMPDFDIDFGSEGRYDVIEYIKEKYGKENVGRIIAYFKRKDGTTFTSTHLASIVICKSEICKLAPIEKDPRSNEIVIQYDMYELENHGFVKLDILGLRTLDIIQRTKELIRPRGGEFIGFNIENIPENDPLTFLLFSEGNTDKVFQFEQEGMKEILKQARPEKLTDLIALNALYRPGLMEQIPQFINSKNSKEEIVYSHPCLKDILEETYGVIVYQEQIIQIIQRVTGYSFGKATFLWRILMKKNSENIEREKESFISNAISNGLEKEQASNLFDTLHSFSKYSFNKAHAAAYAKLAYQTAYLKANFTKEFIEVCDYFDKKLNDAFSNL